MTDASTIREICNQLDPGNDGHWTSQGLPRMDVLATMGLTVERRALNEAMPGFSRDALAKSRGDSATPGEQQAVASPAPPEEDYFELSNRHIQARAARRAEVLEYLHKGGYSMDDLAPVRCRADQRIAARNRAARREFS